MYDENNIFAKILRKEIPCKPIYEDDKVFFFNDINPQAKIHILAIPKMSVTDYNDFISKADNEMIKYFFDKTIFIIIFKVFSFLFPDSIIYRLSCFLIC